MTKIIWEESKGPVPTGGDKGRGEQLYGCQQNNLLRPYYMLCRQHPELSLSEAALTRKTKPGSFSLTALQPVSPCSFTPLDNILNKFRAKMTAET